MVSPEESCRTKVNYSCASLTPKKGRHSRIVHRQEQLQALGRCARICRVRAMRRWSWTKVSQRPNTIVPICAITYLWRNKIHQSISTGQIHWSMHQEYPKKNPYVYKRSMHLPGTDVQDNSKFKLAIGVADKVYLGR